MSSFDLQINGQAYTVEAEPQMPLLWVLRDLLGLTGTKFSCGQGLCGSCTVLIDGEPAVFYQKLARRFSPNERYNPAHGNQSHNSRVIIPCHLSFDAGIHESLFDPRHHHPQFI